MTIQRNKKTLAVLVVVGLWLCIMASDAAYDSSHRFGSPSVFLVNFFTGSLPVVLLGWVLLWWFGRKASSPGSTGKGDQMTVSEAIQDALAYIALHIEPDGVDVYQNLKWSQLTMSLRELSQELRTKTK
jgi:hypothetical protein